MTVKELKQALRDKCDAVKEQIKSLLEGCTSRQKYLIVAALLLLLALADGWALVRGFTASCPRIEHIETLNLPEHDTD